MATNQESTTASTSKQLSNTRSDESRYARTVQNYHLVWLHESTDDTNSDNVRNAFIKLRRIVNNVNTFTDIDECIAFISNIKEQEIFLIISAPLCRTVVPIVHDIRQVHCIHIYCENKEQYEKYTEKWAKVKSMFTDIAQIYETLKRAAYNGDRHSTSISIIETTDETLNLSLDTLDQSFMYSQILKEILTEDFPQTPSSEFLAFCRDHYSNNTNGLLKVEKIYEEHQKNLWIRLYTCNTLYSDLNRALRLMEVDHIIEWGLIVRGLHNDITKLHSEQYAADRGLEPFVVYRGQGLSSTDFNKLKNTLGGLLSFNNFLSTSPDRAFAYGFAESNHDDPDNRDVIGVLFQITIHPSISSCPFANIRECSFIPDEEEVLFSMHSVFRIGAVEQIEHNDRLWQVDLTLTHENDPQLHALTIRLREETACDYGGRYRLAELMILIGEFDKAKELCETLLNQTTDAGQIGHLYCQLGSIAMYQGDYEKAIAYYENSLEIYQKHLPSYEHWLPASYNSIGLAYDNMGERTKALLYYEKAIEIAREALPADDPGWYSFYNNIGAVHSQIGEYAKALSYYEKAHDILQATLPSNHPKFATSYNNTGWVYDKLGKYPEALSSYEKAHEILQKTLPPNHPQLANSYNNIGMMYDSMNKPSESLVYLEKALEILQKTLPANHPEIATYYNNIGAIYENMGNQSEALAYFEKALHIRQVILLANHPDLGSSYNNIGVIYTSTGKLSESLMYLEDALKIRQATLHENHPSLASSYNSIGNTYFYMNEYSKALSYYERALVIYQHILPANHHTIGKVKGSIEVVKKKL